MAEYSSLIKGYIRQYSGPIDLRDYYHKLSDAESYAKSKNSYVGQNITVVDEDAQTITEYEVGFNKELLLKTTTLIKRLQIVADDASSPNYMIINHNFSISYPTVQVMDDNGHLIILDVQYLDAKSVKLSWNGELHGYVNIIQS